jgi:hypothetical protein
MTLSLPRVLFAGSLLVALSSSVRAEAPPKPAESAMKDQSVGEPKAFENLTVFPIFAKAQIDVGAMTTLGAALGKGKAEVREVGADGRGQGAQVNTLVIENKGDVPVYVLAGTVVKGGNQDRQIGQDFVIEAHQATPIDAFCVEHGRWTGSRDGKATAGKFGSTEGMVTTQVRAAAQYKKDQGEVWNKVAEVNASHQKNAESGTLLATLDAPDVQKKKAALAGQVNAFLTGAEPKDNLVGFAFAVDGQVKGVRWFASHKVFELFRAELVGGAAVDALTAQVQRGNKPAPAVAPPKSREVISFVDDVEKGKKEEKRSTKAGNDNLYRESDHAYGSKTMLKPSFGAPAAAQPVSQDYTVK